MANLGFKGEVANSVIYTRCMKLQELAISKSKKVGCVIEGYRQGSMNKEEIEYFGGSNIELNGSNVYHAEIIALVDCIMFRYYPLRLFVTSVSFEENTFLCGHCREQLLEVNKNLEINVLNPNGTLKGTKLLFEVLPHHKNVDEKNEKFYRMLWGDQDE